MTQPIQNPSSIEQQQSDADVPLWVFRADLLWRRRRLLIRIAIISLIASLAIAFLIPKRYKASARIMPPDQHGSGAMMLAALAERSGGLGALGALAGNLYGGHTTTALFSGLLQSGTVSSRLIDRFDLQRIYHKHYRIDTAKRLARNTTVTEDKKSGIITIEVEDTDPTRARDLAQAYLDELNKLVTLTTTSVAHRERVFIEQRVTLVQKDLEAAQLELGEFSSSNATVDIKEQARALVDVSARLQGELLVQQSGLQSLRQMYGDGNIRVRETEARIATLRRELTDMDGSSSGAVATASDSSNKGVQTAAQLAVHASRELDSASLYPRLRQLPRLAVPYADLYRRVKVQETVYELLTQQYEMARIEEAKDIPVVSVIDPPGVPEKKSFPPRLLLTLILTSLCIAASCLAILVHDAWTSTSATDPAKALGDEVLSTFRRHSGAMFKAILVLRRGDS